MDTDMVRPSLTVIIHRQLEKDGLLPDARTIGRDQIDTAHALICKSHDPSVCDTAPGSSSRRLRTVRLPGEDRDVITSQPGDRRPGPRGRLRTPGEVVAIADFGVKCCRENNPVEVPVP